MFHADFQREDEFTTLNSPASKNYPEARLAENEKNLVECAILGDDAALSQLLISSDPELRSRLAGQVGRRYQAALSIADVLQVTYTEAFLRIGRFRSGENGSFLNWLTKIAENNLRNAVRDLNRKKRPPRQRQISFTGESDSHLALLASLSGSQSSPSQQASRLEIKAAIERAINLLPSDYRDVVRGFDIEGKTVLLLAEEMGRSPGAIYMIKARAHVRLAEILGDSTNFFSRGE